MQDEFLDVVFKNAVVAELKRGFWEAAYGDTEKVLYLVTFIYAVLGSE